MMIRLFPSTVAIALCALLASTATAQELAPPAEDAGAGIGALPAQTEDDRDAEQDEAAEAEEPGDAPAADEEGAPPAEGPVMDPEADIPLMPAPDDPALETELGYTRDTFQDWEVRCAPQNDECILYQLALDQDENPVAEFSLVRLPGGGEAVAGVTVITPLGTLLPAGLIFQINGGEARQYPFTFCSQLGCIAQIALTQAQVTALQRGRSARLVVASVAQPNDPVELDLSLMGFTAAYTSLQQED